MTELRLSFEREIVQGRGIFWEQQRNSFYSVQASRNENNCSYTTRSWLLSVNVWKQISATKRSYALSLTSVLSAKRNLKIATSTFRQATDKRDSEHKNNWNVPRIQSTLHWKRLGKTRKSHLSFFLRCAFLRNIREINKGDAIKTYFALSNCRSTCLCAE